MSLSSQQPRRHLLDGTTWVFLAEALMLPMGLVTVIFLTRKLGPENYGLYTLVTVFVIWLEVIISEIFSRATIRFVGETHDWRSVGNTVMRLCLVFSVSAAILLLLFADAISNLMNEPVLATYLRLLAIDIPLFCLASAQRYVLIGTGGFRQRALMSAGRNFARLILIILLVELGFSVIGALLGCIGASLVELIIGSSFIRISPFSRSSFAARRLFGYAVWLFLYSISMIIFSKLDLFMLKILGGTADQAGVYGAAQNLAMILTIFAVSFSPLLLSTLTRMLRDGDDQGARELGRDAMRVVLWLLPFVGATAGAAQEIVVLTFGKPYISAGLILSLLIFAALFIVMIAVATAILTAAGKPAWTFALTGPILPLALAAHFILIPRLAAVGASLTTALFTFLGAFVTVLAVYKIWRVLPTLSTLVRSVLISAAAYALAVLWPTPSFLLLLKLPLIAIFIAVAFKLAGEFSADDIALVRSILRRQPAIHKTRSSNNT